MKHTSLAFLSIFMLTGCVTVRDGDQAFEVRNLTLEYYQFHAEWPKKKSDLIQFSEKEGLSYDRSYYSLKFVPIDDGNLKLEYARGLLGNNGFFILSPSQRPTKNTDSSWRIKEGT